MLMNYPSTAKKKQNQSFKKVRGLFLSVLVSEYAMHITNNYKVIGLKCLPVDTPTINLDAMRTYPAREP